MTDRFVTLASADTQKTLRLGIGATLVAVLALLLVIGFAPNCGLPPVFDSKTPKVPELSIKSQVSNNLEKVQNCYTDGDKWTCGDGYWWSVVK